MADRPMIARRRRRLGLIAACLLQGLLAACSATDLLGGSFSDARDEAYDVEAGEATRDSTVDDRSNPEAETEALAPAYEAGDSDGAGSSDAFDASVDTSADRAETTADAADVADAADAADVGNAAETHDDGACETVSGGSLPDGSFDAGPFWPYVAVPIAAETVAVAIGDLNADGRNDLVVSTSDGYGSNPQNDDSLFVFYQNACGGLEPPVQYFGASGATGQDINTVAIGDVNGDGRNDLVTDQPNALAVWVQNAQGALNPAVTYPLPRAPFRVRIADLNGDGRLDVFALGDVGYEFLQTTAGALSAPLSYPGPFIYLQDLALGDVTGDGRADVMIAGNGAIEVLPQQLDGTLGSPVVYNTYGGSRAQAASIGDVTGDRLADVVVSGALMAPYVSVFAQNDGGTLQPPVAYYGDSALSLGIGDVNGDGRNDVVYFNDQLLSVQYQSSTGTLTAASTYACGNGNNGSPEGLAFGDLNGDGKPDVAAALGTWGGITLLYNAR